jgi:putative phage-type endonuclease
MIKQNTPEWLEMRKNYLGASDAPTIMGIYTYRTPIDIYNSKLLCNYEDECNIAMQRGKEMEEPARLMYQDMKMCIVEPTVLFHPKHKFMMASLDGFCEESKVAVEIKNPCKEDHEIARSGNVPEKYFPQLQHQLEILFALYGIDMIDYFSLNNGEGLIVEVRRDEKYIQNLIEKEHKFWFDHVLALNEPALTDKDYVDKNDDLEWNSFVEQWKRVSNSIKEFKKQESMIRNELIRLSDGFNSMGAGIKLKKNSGKMSIDYKSICESIPEYTSIDKSKFMKTSKEYWTIY